MAQEIERKFLVCGDYKPYVFHAERLIQGYLSSVPERTVRVRIKGEKAYLTIKGKTDASGMSRFEWEQEIGLKDAGELLQLCELGKIDKVRSLVKAGKHVFEVDEFYGENAGLILAEVELQTAGEKVEKPAWLGREVTGDLRYYNAMLVKHPFQSWPENLRQAE